MKNFRELTSKVTSHQLTAGAMAKCAGGCKCSRRLTLAILGFGLLAVLSGLRDVLSVAIVCMVGDEDTLLIPYNSTDNSTDTWIIQETREFPWDKTEQSLILSMFFAGFFLSTLLGLWLLKHDIIRYYMGGGLLVASTSSLILPFCMKIDIRLIYPLRVIMGMCTAIAFPGLQSMWGKWAPQSELSKLATLAASGRFMGTVIVFSLTGLMCGSLESGWKIMFYILGGFGLVWFVVWQLLTSHNPKTDPFITSEERDFIVSNLAINYEEKMKVPWKKLLTSRPVWGCMLIHMMCDWLDYSITTLGPTYMHEVLHFNIAQNGVLSALPHLCRAISTLLVGRLANFIIKRKLLTIKLVRMIFQTVATVGSSACIVGLGFISQEQRAIGVVLLIIAFCFQAFSESSYQVNEVEIAPRFSGLISGLGNSLSGVAGVLAPILTGALTPNKTQAEWRNSFLLVVGLMTFGLTMYLVFLDTKVQPWAEEKPKKIVTTVVKYGTEADKEEKENNVARSQLK